MIDIDEISLSKAQMKKLQNSYQINKLKHGIGNIQFQDNKKLAAETNLPLQLVTNWLKNQDAKSNPSNVKFNLFLKL